MPAPLFATRHFTFTHEVAGDSGCEEGEGSAAKRIPVAGITLQLVSFDNRCFWLHVALSREGVGAPPPPFGACAVSFSGVTGEGAATTLLDDAVLPQQALQASQHEVGVSAPNPQAMFAESLARRLSRRLERERGSGVAVYVACGISGNNQAELLGTPTGHATEATRRFGAEVFKHAVELIQGKCTGKTAVV